MDTLQVRIGEKQYPCELGVERALQPIFCDGSLCDCSGLTPDWDGRYAVGWVVRQTFRVRIPIESIGAERVMELYDTQGLIDVELLGLHIEGANVPLSMVVSDCQVDWQARTGWLELKHVNEKFEWPQREKGC